MSFKISFANFESWATIFFSIVFYTSLLDIFEIMMYPRLIAPVTFFL